MLTPLQVGGKPGEWVEVHGPVETWNKQIQMKAIKQDEDKPRMDLLDPDFLEDVAKVLTFGAKKYADNNWRNGFRVGRLIAACFRHLIAIVRREDIDPESGFPHSAHLGCSVMFLHWYLKHKRGVDDRWHE